MDEVFESKVNFIKRTAPKLSSQDGKRSHPVDQSASQARPRGNSGTGNSGSKQQAQKGKKVTKFEPHFINHLEEIGWVDPIPDPETIKAAEASNITKIDMDRSCYHEAKMISDYPPLTVYLPSPALAKKMMTICSRVFAKN